MSDLGKISILRLKDVAEKTRLSRSTIYCLAAAGEFPSPIRLGAKASGWIAHEIEEWLQSRIERTRGVSASAKR